MYIGSIRTLPTTVSILTSFAKTWDPSIPWSKVIDIFPPFFGTRNNAFLQWMNATRKFPETLSNKTFVEIKNPKMATAIGTCMIKDF
jgi:hypothetical protein